MMSCSTRLCFKLANGEVYPFVNRLSKGAERIVVDPKTATVIILYPDHTASFWGAFHTGTPRVPDLKAAMGHANFIAWQCTRRIPVGLSDITYLHLEVVDAHV
jgi:hypothetical protein